MAEKSPPAPPSPEARDNALAELKASPAPLTARDLAKRLLPPLAIPEKALTPILEESVAAGTVHVAPAQTAKSKPRYWDRDVLAEGRDAALRLLQGSDEALTAQEIAQRIPNPADLREADIAPLLAGLAEAGQVHAHPPATARGKPRFSRHDALGMGRLLLLRTLESKGPQPFATLRKALKALSDEPFQAIVERLQVERKLWRHPPVGKGKSAKELWGVRPPSPEPYLGAVAKELASAVPRLLDAGVSRDDLRRALVQILDSAGISVGSPGPSPAVPHAVDLIELMKRLEPGAERGALVGTRDLRRAARLEKAVFDQAVLDLARQGRLSLHRHDYPASLSPAEQEELVTDGEGAFYVGIALRHPSV